MRREVNQIFQALLDKSRALGVGWIDRNGFTIHHLGWHNGLDIPWVAANVISLDRIQQNFMRQSFDDACLEQVILGEMNDYYLLHVLDTSTLLYALTDKKVMAGIVRTELYEASSQLKTMFVDAELIRTARERLEQPRKFKRLLRTR